MACNKIICKYTACIILIDPRKYLSSLLDKLFQRELLMTRKRRRFRHIKMSFVFLNEVFNKEKYQNTWM